MNPTLGQLIQSLRQQKGWTQAELALYAGVSLRTLQGWEINRGEPTLWKALKLAEALEVELDVLAAVARQEGKKPREQEQARSRGRPPQASPERK